MFLDKLIKLLYMNLPIEKKKKKKKKNNLIYIKSLILLMGEIRLLIIIQYYNIQYMTYFIKIYITF